MTDAVLMLTGGIKTRRQAAEVIARGDADLVGLARTMVLDPHLGFARIGAAVLSRNPAPPP